MWRQILLCLFVFGLPCGTLADGHVNVNLTPNGSVVVDYLSNITFTCSFETDEDPEPFSIFWGPLDRDLNVLQNELNGTISMLILSGVTLSDSGNYTCAVFDNANISIFNFVHVLLTVKPPPPSDIAITPSTPTRALSSNVTFTCTVTSLTQPTITWSTDATTGITTQPDVLTASQGNNTYTSMLVLNGVTLDSIGGYNCTATNDGGTNTTTATLNVIVSGLTVDVPDTVVVTYGMNLRATCTVATLVLPVTVEWTFNQTVVTSMTYNTGSTLQLELSVDNIDLNSGGVYTCKANYENVTETDDTSVTVFVPPPEVTCTFNPGETWVLNYGDNVTFTCTVTSLTQPTITWSTNATTGITTQPDVLTAFQGNDTYTSTLTLNGVTLDNIGRYIFNATNEGGSVATNAMLYVFGLPPSVTIAPPTQSVNYSGNATFTCTVTSISALEPSLLWFTNATNRNITACCNVTLTSEGNTYTSTLVLNGVTLDSIGGYNCTATNEGGSNTATATLNVEVPPPEVTVTPDYVLIVDYNSNVTFTCTVTSLTQPTITWSAFSPITNIPDSTTTSQGSTYTSTLVLNGVIVEHLGQYTCNATNEGGSVTATTDLLVTGLPPSVTVTPPTQSVNYSGNTTFTCTVTSISIEKPLIIWSTNATNRNITACCNVTSTSEGNDTYTRSTSTLTLNGVTQDSIGGYTCDVTNDGGSNTATATLNVQVPSPVVVVPDTVNVTYGMNLRVNCTVTTVVLPVTVQWILGQTVVTSMDYSTGSTHQLELSVDNVNLTNDGVYTCRAFHDYGAGMGNTSVTVTVPSPVVVVPDTVNVTYGMDLRVNCTVTTVLPDAYVAWLLGSSFVKTMIYNIASTYQLELSIDNVNLTNGGVYTCKAFHEYGDVTGNTSVTVTVPPPSDIAIAPTAQSVNHSDTATFTCTVTSLTQPTITWSTNATTGITTQPDVLTASQGNNMYTSTLVLDGVTLDSIGGYTCNVTNYGGSNTATATLNVIVPASGVFLVPVEAVVLYNRTLQLNCTVSSRTYPNIMWSTTANITINDADIVTTNESNYMFSSVLTLNGVDLSYSGFYTCSSTNQGGSANDTSTVTVNLPLPTVSLPDDFNITYSEALRIKCTVTSLMRPSSIKWYQNGSLLADRYQSDFTRAPTPADTYTSILVKGSAGLNDTGVYMCVAVNAAGQGNDTVNVQVIVPFPVILNLNSLNVTIGLNATFNCTASGFGLTYDWETPSCGNDCEFIGVDRPLLTVFPVTLAGGDKYTCTVTDLIGNSVNKTVNLNPLGPTLLESNISNCPLKNENNTCIDRCNDDPVPVVNGTDRFLRCVFQNRPDAPANLTINWSCAGTKFRKCEDFYNTTFMTTPEDENRIVRTVMKFSPVNYLNFDSTVIDYIGFFECHAYIGDLFRDRTESDPTCLEVYFAPIIITEPESVTRINVNETTFDIGCGSKANPRAEQHVFRSLRNGSNGTYYRGRGHLVNLYNVTYDDAGNYTCTVSNDYGSDERKYEVIVQDVPNQVVNVTVTLLSFFDAQVSWPQPSNNFGFDQKYIVTSRLITNTATNTTATNTTVTNPYYKITELAVDQAYTVSVLSTNNVGLGLVSPVVSFNSISPGMASVLRLIAPSILTFSKEIFISWSLPPLFRPEEEKHAIISSYIVSYTANGATSGNVPLRPSNNSVNMTLPSLLPATEYNISVVVHYEEPAGLKGDLVYIVRKTKPADNLPETPTNITDDFNTSTPSILVTWEPLSPADGAEYLQRYVVRVNVTDLSKGRRSRKRRQNRLVKTLEYNVSSSDRDFTFSDVKPYMQYDIGVGATVLIDGMEREIPITRPRSVSSPEARPMAPVNFWATKINFTSVSLAWDPPDVPNGIITKYHVQYQTANAGSRTPLTELPVTRRSITITGLTGDMTYTFYVKAQTAAGIGEEASVTNTTHAGVAPFGAPVLIENTDHSDRLNVRVSNFSSRYGPLQYYKIVVVTSLSVNTNSIPDSTLLPHDNPSWENYQYYVAALYYYYNQSTTVTIGSGIRFTFDGVSYTDVALESGKAYRVFIRLYSGADKPEQPYRDSPISNTIEISTPLNLAFILVPILIIIFFIILVIIIVIVVCIVCNKKQARKQETFYLDEIDKTENSMKLASTTNGASQRSASTASAAKSAAPEGKASAGLYTPTLSVNSSAVYTSTGQPTLLICESGGTPAPTVTWHKEGMILEEPDYTQFSDGSLYIATTKLRDQGHFIVRATNSVGVVEESIRVTVVAPSPPESDPNHPPLSVSDFIEMMALLQSNNSDRLEEEYPDIEMEWNFTTYAAKLPVHHSKNRYVNIIPYDHSRVVLKHDGTPGSDYINGSFVDGLNTPKAYIATQGPVPAAFPDFWRMIWEYNVPTIVMVTNLKEDDKIKCHQYWPSYGTANYGNFQVTLKEVENIADYAIRTFQLQSLQGQGTFPIKEVRQYHFLVWPDHGVPQYATPLLSFQKRVRNYHKGKPGPMVVHCSAGVGRTGTFITIDTMLMKIDAEGMVDIFNFVRSMRFCRNYMVQTASQYDFLHHAILEAIMCRDTTIAAVNMSTKIVSLKGIVPSSGKTGFQSQFETLESSSPTDEDFDCSIAQLPDNLAKSRIRVHLPPNDYRVVLSTKNYDSDFICASYVDGYRQKSAFIATQGPMKNTAGDFWRMVWEMKSMIIIMLTNTEENEEEQSVQYWPSNPNEEEMYGSFNVIAVPQDRTLPDYIVRKFKVSHSSNPDESRTITQFQYINWSSTVCPKEATSIIDLIADVVRIQRKSGNGPITVHCSDGLGRTGTFCAMFTVLERLKAEQVIDVFSTVKTLRIQRPGLINDLDQYEFIHKAALEFVNTFDNYDNFKY